ncbi:MAG: CAP domain-containing protein [Burkholderiales bacterium]|nr:CAP domain-containing protein [Burkholderiales bacterium]
MRAFLIRFQAAALMAAASLWAQAEPTPRFPVGPQLARHWTSPENRSTVLEALNTERQRHRLAPLRLHAQLQEAAQAHADYLAQHGEASHGQRAGLAGFTGARPLQRARAAGYEAAANEVAELFVVGLSDVPAALEQLLSGPYHRHFLLWAAASEVGVGLSEQPGLVLSLGAPRAGAMASPEWVLWPTPDARDVPPLACCERPRPAGLDEFGTPVSVQAPLGVRLSVQQFQLLDAEGRAVPTRLLQADSDPHLASAVHVAYLLPLQALQGKHRYRVELRAQAGSRSLQRQWHFETR